MTNGPMQEWSRKRQRKIERVRPNERISPRGPSRLADRSDCNVGCLGSLDYSSPPRNREKLPQTFERGSPMSCDKGREGNGPFQSREDCPRCGSSNLKIGCAYQDCEICGDVESSECR